MKIPFGKFLRAQARYRGYAIQPQTRFTTYRNRESRHSLTLCPVSHVASDDFYRRLDGYIDGADLALLEGIQAGDQILSADYQTSSMVTLDRFLDYTGLAQRTGLASQRVRSDAPNAQVADIVLTADNHSQLVQAFSTLEQTTRIEEVVARSLIRIFPRQPRVCPWEGTALAQVAVAALFLDSEAMARRFRQHHPEAYHWVVRVRHQILFRSFKAALRLTGSNKICLVYGALHMPDIDQRLRRRGWRITSTRWETLWD